MLRWLSFGASLLTLGELQEARLTCPGEEETVAWDDPGSIQDITHILGDLVYVEEPAYVLAQDQNRSSQAPRSRVAYDSFQHYVQEHSSKAMNGPAESDRKALYAAWLLQDGEQFSNVRLAHFSVKEYLLSGRIPHQLSDDFNLRRTAAREFLAQSCLVYLLHYSRSETKRASAADFAAFPLLRHAALHWPAYVDPTMAEPLRHELQFLQDDRARTAWVRVLTSNQGVWDQTQKPKYTYGTALYFASSLGHQACVEWLLKQTDVDVNALAGPYNTALQAASANGHQAIVDMLLRHGANPNVLRSLSLAYTVTALCAASTHGHHGIVISLLAHGADPDLDSDDPFRDRPLYAASEHGHIDIVASLLQAGAEVNHYGSHRGTAIRVAAEKGFERIVELLLRAGSGVDEADEIHLLTPLMAALDAGHTRIAKRLIESEAVVTTADGHGVTALERAAEDGHIDLLELMLKVGFGVGWQDAKCSALLAAIRYGHLDGVRILMQHGASVHASREPTFTPLCAACLYGREEIADLLIKTGARVNVWANLETHPSISFKHLSAEYDKRISGEETESAHDIYINRPWTVRAPPLHRAAWRGHVGVVSLLLRAGAKVDARRSGSTALQEAAYRGHAGVVRLLLEAGADVSASAGEFGTPMQAARKFGHHDVTRVLEAFEVQQVVNE
jgi:ankyrin repeat protein